MSGQFSEKQLEEAEKNIIENTQVRFANISIKVSDEFMNCVEEQNLYGTDKILVYKKMEKTGPVQGISADEHNFAYSMGEKDIKKYELAEKFNTIDELNAYLLENDFSQIKKEKT